MALIEPHEIPTTASTPPASFWLWGSDPTDGQTSKKLAIDDLYRRATGAANLWVDAQSGSANIVSRGTASGGFIAQDTGATSGVQAFQLFTNGGVTELRGMNDALSAGTASFMAVDMTNNRIGFGTAAPPVKLYATGTGSTELIQIKSTAVNGQAGFRMANDAQTYTVYVSSADDLIFADNTSGLNPIRVEAGAAGSSIYVANSGGLNPHVGIGTTSPQGALHVVNFPGEGTPTFNAADKFIFQGNATATSFTRMSLIGGTTADVAYMMGDKDAHDECRLQWRTDDRDFAVLIDSNRVVDIEAGAPANSLYIQSDGSVGLGKVPGVEFHVYQATGNMAGLLESDGLNSVVTFGTANDAQRWDVGVNASDQWRLQDVTGSKNVFLVEPNAPTNSLYIKSDGSVGIGTSSPATKLHISGTDASLFMRIATSAVNGQAGVRMVNDARSWAAYVDTLDRYNIRDETAATSPLVIQAGADGSSIFVDADGHVGLGADPGASVKFYVLDSSTSMVSRFKSTGLNSDVALRMENDAHVWDVRCNSADNFDIRDTSNATTVMVIEAGADANSFRIDSSGNAALRDSLPRVAGLTVRPAGDSGTVPAGLQSGIAVINTSAAGDSASLNLIAGTSGNSKILLGDSSDADACQIIYDHGDDGLTFLTNGSTVGWGIDADRNLTNLTAAATPTSLAGGIYLSNGTAPTASLTNGVILWAEDISASSELRVRDEASNVTTLSPHAFHLFERPHPLAWSYHSENDHGEINVDMYSLAREVERLSGKKLVFIREKEKKS